MEITKEKLKELGLDAASDKLLQAERLEKAYRDYMYVTPNKLDDFNAKLREDTMIEDENARSYKTLAFIPLQNYTEIPPADVLDDLSKAKKAEIFDTFEVCKVEWHKEVKDPILFGRVNGCEDRFFISQWDDDIAFSDFFMSDLETKKES